MGDKEKRPPGEHVTMPKGRVERLIFRSTFNRWQLEALLKEACYRGVKRQPEGNDRVTIDSFGDHDDGFEVIIERLIAPPESAVTGPEDSDE
jgi:hypothetical protein